MENRRTGQNDHSASSSLLTRLSLRVLFDRLAKALRIQFLFVVVALILIQMNGGTAYAEETADDVDDSMETYEEMETDEEDSQDVDSQKSAEELQRELDEFLRDEYVLIKQGELEVEFSAFYFVETAVNLRLRERFGDEFQDQVSPKFTSRSAEVSLLVRYGIIDDLELDVTVPMDYIEQEADFSDFETTGELSNVQDSDLGLGDISAGLRYTIWHEDGAWPTTTLNVDGKSRTGDEDKSLGSGHWDVGGGLTLVKTIDPVVLFGSLGYTATLENGGRDPGDQIDYSLGMGFSLNDRTSWSMSLAGTFIMQDEVDGKTVPGSKSDIDTLQFGVTIQLARRLFVEPQVGFGLTEDATDFFVGVNIPYSFKTLVPYGLF